MLDSVPDKVIIMTKASESSVPKSLYCNLQTKQFFGGDLVKKEDPDRAAKPE